LRGLTRTQLGPSPSELVLRTDTGDPVLARRRVGRGWTLAWTADLKPRLGLEWLRSPQFPRFMAQLVRAHQRRDDEHVVPLDVKLEGRDAVVTFEAKTSDGRFDSSWVSSLSLQSEGTGALDVPFRLDAPGRYVARAALPTFGAYALMSTHERRAASGELVRAGVGRATVSLPYPEEYRELEPRLDLLGTWAEAGAGRFDPTAAEFLAPGTDRRSKSEPAQAPLLYVALALLLLDVLLRRVRLFDRGFRKVGP
jgi:Ca-activated chloride channel homolog